jgi:ADP-ribose pyrophosphatase YjhB (NUDIX family)
MQDICISLENYVFNYRVGAIITHQRKLLVNQLAGQKFWFLPGGRVGEGEMSSTALERELSEELSSPCQVIRSLFLAESIFELDSSKFHELCLYYLVELPSDSPLYSKASFEMAMDGGLYFKWHDINDLASINFQPHFLRDKLMVLPERLEHVMFNEYSMSKENV